MPKLSVIMPVYNTAKFLERSINSVLNQTFTDFELILVNDGSKDNSLDVCREFEKKDNRIKVVDKENGGAGSARNAGLAVCSGEFVAFPDSDDWIDPDAYAFCIEKMEVEGLDLLVFGSLNTVYDNDGKVLSVAEGSADDL
ncbi:MAG: glycosyltransferase, partial [Clostridia bacterium]|nr:glycosyltransferase [Clostridia bacterium]